MLLNRMFCWERVATEDWLSVVYLVVHVTLVRFLGMNSSDKSNHNMTINKSLRFKRGTAQQLEITFLCVPFIYSFISTVSGTN